MARDMPDPSVAAAKSAGLVYCSDARPGVSRTIDAKGVRYFDADGKLIKDEDDLARFRALAIPPAWTEVWICPHPRGHIQAVGRDAKGRKQYRYHADWRAERDRHKFGRMAQFARALPKLRRRVEADLKKRGLPREKVLAAVVRLLELTLIRVGNDEYAKTNKSFGLTTLRDRHFKMAGGKAVFEFVGKSGVKHRTGFNDKRLARVVKACQDIPGQRLFQYIDADGQRRSIESADVNAYIREATGGDFTAKDFRTWAGTLLAARALLIETAPESAAASKRSITTCIKVVSGVLGNTPAVCRACYVHPAVIEHFAKGELAAKLGRRRDVSETAMRKFLEGLEAAAS